MADDVTLDSMTGGEKVATDQDGSSRHHQWMKLKFGPDDTFSIVEDGVGLPVAPFAAILETSFLELIGEDSTEVSASGDYSNTADFALGATMSGEILSFLLVSHENGSGEVQTGKGVVFFFDADPNIVAGATAMAAIGAEHATLIGMVQIEASEWDEDASGASVVKTVAIPFHAISTIYAVYRNTDTVALWNSAAGDNEVLDMRFWFRRDS